MRRLLPLALLLVVVAAAALPAQAGPVLQYYRYDGAWGSLGTGPGQFNEPTGICFSAGKLYVTETQNHRVQVFGPDGSFVSQWGSSGSGANDLSVPWGVDVDSGGNIYLGDSGNHRVNARTSLWALSRLYTPVPATTDGLRGLAVSPPYLYVANAELNCVDIWNTDGTWLGSSTGDSTYSYSQPNGVALDDGGILYIADSGHGRILRMEAGVITACWEGFSWPYSVCTDAVHAVYVADTLNNRIVKLNTTGQQLAVFGTSGPGALLVPRDIAVSDTGAVFVTDSNHHRIVRFTRNHRPFPPTAVSISPAHPLDGQNLAARPTGASDADGDTLRLQYRWYYRVNTSVGWTLSAYRNRVLPASATTPWQYWMVRCRAFDGLEYSGWKEAPAVRIRPNTAPALLTAAASPTARGAEVAVALGADADLTLTVLNLAGGEVAVVARAQAPAGAHALLWNRSTSGGTRAPAGQYLLRLQARTAAGEVATRLLPLVLR